MLCFGCCWGYRFTSIKSFSAWCRFLSKTNLEISSFVHLSPFLFYLLMENWKLLVLLLIQFYTKPIRNLLRSAWKTPAALSSFSSHKLWIPLPAFMEMNGYRQQTDLAEQKINHCEYVCRKGRHGALWVCRNQDALWDGLISIGGHKEISEMKNMFASTMRPPRTRHSPNN